MRYHYALKYDVTMKWILSHIFPFCTRFGTFHIILILFYGVKEKITFGRGAKKGEKSAKTTNKTKMALAMRECYNQLSYSIQMHISNDVQLSQSGNLNSIWLHKTHS